MIEWKHPVPGSPADGNVDEEIWLLGQPSLGEYLDFVRDSVVGGADANPAEVTAEWREANAYYQELEDSESGLADRAELRALDPSLTPLAEEARADPIFRSAFNTMPTDFGMVELDRLILCQKSVTGTFVDALKARLGPAPDPEALFRFCLPLGTPDTRVQSRRVGSKRFVFSTDSLDLRFHGATLLRPGQISDYASFGPISGVVGLVVGFGSNFLNVIKADHRLLLHNGYHRACALRALGITHAPCVIQTVTGGDELSVTAKSSVAANPDFYFRSARPPLLKDFFDARIRRPLPVHKQLRMIEVNFEVREFLVRE